jgi:hypothetical protein
LAYKSRATEETEVEVLVSSVAQPGSTWEDRAMAKQKRTLKFTKGAADKEKSQDATRTVEEILRERARAMTKKELALMMLASIADLKWMLFEVEGKLQILRDELEGHENGILKYCSEE